MAADADGMPLDGDEPPPGTTPAPRVAQHPLPRRPAQPKPAVAGLSDAGPLAGAGFSAGPDSGASILPDGYGQRMSAGTHTVTLVGKSKPLATTAGVDG